MSRKACPHIVSSNEGTHYCDLAETAVRERDAEIERIKAVLEAFARRYECVCKHNRCKRCELTRRAKEVLHG